MLLYFFIRIERKANEIALTQFVRYTGKFIYCLEFDANICIFDRTFFHIFVRNINEKKVDVIKEM